MKSGSLFSRLKAWAPVVTVVAVVVASSVCTAVAIGNLGDRLDSVEARFDVLGVRLDTFQVENTRQHEATRAEMRGMREVIRALEARMSRLEGLAAGI